MTSTTFATSFALVLDEIYNIKELHRSARTKLTRFAIDACLVAHSVRTGYLVDAVSPPNPERTFAVLLKALRRKSAVFEHVVCWHHAPTAQSFLVHIPLLQERLTAVLGGTGECVFIHLDKRLSMTREPPEKLHEALRGMECSMTELPDALVLSLSDSFTEENLVPLAAVVIDYPVAYVPAHSAQTSFLDGEPLDIYTISFQEISPLGSTLDVGKEHVLLKFSCPQVLANNHTELSSGQLIEKLKVKFTARLGRIGIQVIATHHTETLDRVAL